MNKIIKEQLSKCKCADLSHYNEIKHTYIIPKINKIELEINNYYFVKLNQSIFNPSQNDVFFNNWNKGTHPEYEYVKIFIKSTLGNIINVSTLAYDYINKKDLDIVWNGWIPKDQLTVLAKLN